MSTPTAITPTEATMPITIRPVEQSEFFAWYALFADYADFYETPLSDETAVLVWSWIIDPAAELDALVAVDEEGALVGFAHHRTFLRPLAGSKGIYLDDLFVSPAHRGKGVGTQLIDAVAEIGKSRRASIVRWITADDNETAQRLYDKVAQKTTWVTYDKELA
ncbi:GNAT family N-acetyltransferase [Cnuibacter physcomitrellae]|nr:GNAT family N-acetyltransferase [Cnuibacter physcomitrellae]